MKFIILVTLILNLGMVSFANELSDYLLPRPQKLTVQGGYLEKRVGRILIPADQQQVLSIAQSIKTILSGSNLKTELTRKLAANEEALFVIELDPRLKSQSYELTITNQQIKIVGGDAAGVYYASKTLKQIALYVADNKNWPCLQIIDAPEFPRRGVMIDVSRDKVPTMETFYLLIDQLASWKMNEIQLYTEHTFAYQNHKVVWEMASPLTAEEIILLDAYCHDRFIDLVPNQNSFGHMEQWLKHDTYLPLAELPKPVKDTHGILCRGSISAAVPKSMELINELYAELLPNFSSKYFNIGCDETVELGKGLSRQMCEQKGVGQVYLDFLVQLNDAAKKNGKKVQFWGDIILNHPELISKVPKDMTALVWGYDADCPFDANCAKYKDAGVSFYVCPGTSSWNTIIGRNKCAFGNLLNAAVNGKKHGALGYLITDWGDCGHWQPLSVSYPAFAYGAALSWQVQNNEDVKVTDVVSREIFNDPTGISGEVIFNLGNAYLETGIIGNNTNIFHNILRYPDMDFKTDGFLKQVTAENLDTALIYLDKEMKRFEEAQIQCAQKDIVYKEMTLAVDLTKFACEFGKVKVKMPQGDLRKLPANERAILIARLKSIMYRHQILWIVRNRIGGLDDSLSYMKKILDYLERK